MSFFKPLSNDDVGVAKGRRVPGVTVGIVSCVIGFQNRRFRYEKIDGDTLERPRAVTKHLQAEQLPSLWNDGPVMIYPRENNSGRSRIETNTTRLSLK